MPFGAIILMIFILIFGGVTVGQNFSKNQLLNPKAESEVVDSKKEEISPKKELQKISPTIKKEVIQNSKPSTQETNLQSEVKVEVKNAVRMITATGSYKYSNAEISYTINFPENGGDVTGNVSGICNGPITGRYVGGDGGEIKGNIDAKCQVLLLTQSLNADYSGKVYLKEGRIDVSYDGDIPFFTDSGSFTLNFNPL